jgi:hypothetical protein
MPAPVLNPPGGNPGRINLSWTHLPNATYSVYRSDTGLLNASPLAWDSALGSYRTITYSDSSPHYANTTYAYTVKRSRDIGNPACPTDGTACC